MTPTLFQIGTSHPDFAFFAQSLFVAILVELCLIVICLAFHLKNHPSPIRLLSIATVASCVTLPIMWYVLLPNKVHLAIVHTFVVLVEMGFYRFLGSLSWKNAFFLSLLANTASMAMTVGLARM